MEASKWRQSLGGAFETLGGKRLFKLPTGRRRENENVTRV